METTMEILIIILGIALAVFLTLSLVAVYKLVKILNTVKRLVDKAESLAESAEAVSKFLSSNTGKVSVVKAISSIVKSILKLGKKGSRRK